MFDNFKDLITNILDETVLIFLHQNADPDAICSAEAIGELIVKINPSIKYQIYGDRVNYSAKRVMLDQNIQVHQSSLDTISDHIITVDTANYSQLGKYSNLIKNNYDKLVAFDHHEENVIFKDAKVTIFDKNSPSTCVIVSKLYKSFNIIPSARIATLLICGHLYDSRRFIHGATAQVFHIIAELIECGGDYALANEYLQNDMSHGEKIARLKAVKRLEYYVINKLIISTSRVSAFESSAARALIGLGSDVVFVIARKDKEIRGSGRIKNDVPLNMGEILTSLAKEFKTEGLEPGSVRETSGGGHKGAAGLNIKSELSNRLIKQLLKKFVSIVEQQLLTSELSSMNENNENLDDIEIINN